MSEKVDHLYNHWGDDEETDDDNSEEDETDEEMDES
jgi:hypothetical protein